jgi:hypothetical protein
MRGLTFEKPKDRYSLSECYTNFLTILRIYRTTMKLIHLFKEYGKRASILLAKQKLTTN